MSQINKVSSATKDAIKRKSAYALPDRPSDMGMKPEDIKRAFWQPIVDVTFSAISEIDRLIDELNTIMTGNYDAHIADKNNPHAVTKAQVGLGNCNNTADADKPVSAPQRTALNTHNTATDAHSDIRNAITNGLALKVAYTDVVDGFASTEVNKPLSAYRGKVLYDSLQTTISKADNAIKNISLNSENGVLTITRTDGTSFTIDLPLEYIVKSGSYNASTKNIELVLDNDEKIEIPVGALVNEYYGDGTTVTLYIDSADGNKPKFKISDTYKNKIDNALVSSDLNNFLTANTAQEITALKTFQQVGAAFQQYGDTIVLKPVDEYIYAGTTYAYLPHKTGTLAMLDDVSQQWDMPFLGRQYSQYGIYSGNMAALSLPKVPNSDQTKYSHYQVSLSCLKYQNGTNTHRTLLVLPALNMPVDDSASVTFTLFAILIPIDNTYPAEFVRVQYTQSNHQNSWEYTIKFYCPYGTQLAVGDSTNGYVFTGISGTLGFKE